MQDLPDHGAPGASKASSSPDDDLRLQFEAATRLSEEEKRALKTVIEGILLAHEARRWAA